jgi:hypothetical protein
MIVNDLRLLLSFDFNAEPVSWWWYRVGVGYTSYISEIFTVSTFGAKWPVLEVSEGAIRQSLRLEDGQSKDVDNIVYTVLHGAITHKRNRQQIHGAW